MAGAGRGVAPGGADSRKGGADERVLFTTEKADLSKMEEVCERFEHIAARANIRIEDRLSRLMDLSACHANGCPIRLDALLEADDSNFVHDVAGITRHIDRRTGRLQNCFLPRFHDLGVAA